MQTALTQLGDQAELDPATRQAMEKLPTLARSPAIGRSGRGTGPDGRRAGRAKTARSTARSASCATCSGRFESRLATVKSQVESQQALRPGRPRPVWPLVGWLTSLYGNRKDPFTGQPDFHPGLDISARVRHAGARDGGRQVESAGYNGNYGNSVVVDHGFGIGTRFGHLSRLAVSAGQKVKRGEVIGYVGATGRATSSHLHYEILFNGQPINPLRLLAR